MSIKSIFNDGYCHDISVKTRDELNKLKIPSPLAYKKNHGLPHPTDGYADKANAKRWATAVIHILNNETYTGTLIQGRQGTPKYKVKNIVYKPRSEWMCTEGAHEAIISKYFFELVRRIQWLDTRTPPRGDKVYVFSGLLICGHCSCAMTGICGTSSTGKIHQYYCCVTQRRHGDCKKKAVKKDYIEDFAVEKVLYALNSDYIDTIAQKISNLSAKESNTDTLKRLNRLLKENEDATANLVKAIETGKEVDVLSAQIEKRQSERADLEV